MFYQRTILPKLEAEIKTKEIVIITGMRQVGKTTLLRHLFSLIPSENKAIFDLENPLHRKVFEEEDYDGIWHNLKVFGVLREEKSFLFLDEAQNLPEISRVIKYLHDHYQIKIFVTGSSSYYLRNLFPESLAGRKVIFELFPLTFKEFLSFNNVKIAATKKNELAYKKLIGYYREFMEYGGFPGVVLEKNHARKKKMLEEIFTSYFEKDVKNLADFRDMAKLRDLILLLVPRIGSRLEIAKLASELSLSRETVYNYLSFLEKTYFVFLMSRYTGSIDRQVAGGKKVFLCDSGMANVLGRLSQGQLFEQSIFQNLRPGHGLTFYSKEGKSEIDFVVDKEKALEAKFSASRRDVANLEKRVKRLGLKQAYVVAFEYSPEEKVVLATDL